MLDFLVALAIGVCGTIAVVAGCVFGLVYRGLVKAFDAAVITAAVYYTIQWLGGL